MPRRDRINQYNNDKQLIALVREEERAYKALFTSIEDTDPDTGEKVLKLVPLIPNAQQIVDRINKQIYEYKKMHYPDLF
jgi:hypothetical protein